MIDEANKNHTIINKIYSSNSDIGNQIVFAFRVGNVSVKRTASTRKRKGKLDRGRNDIRGIRGCLFMFENSGCLTAVFISARKTNY